VSTPGGTRPVYGDIALVVFLVAQVLDGALTYLGVTLYGPQMEGNPLIAWLMARLGDGPGLATAKITASFFGIVLHVSAVHRVVALLAAFYIIVAIVPWTVILFVL
jgi:hypothetical protein